MPQPVVLMDPALGPFALAPNKRAIWVRHRACAQLSLVNRHLVRWNSTSTTDSEADRPFALHGGGGWGSWAGRRRSRRRQSQFRVVAFQLQIGTPGRAGFALPWNGFTGCRPFWWFGSHRRKSTRASLGLVEPANPAVPRHQSPASLMTVDVGTRGELISFQAGGVRCPLAAARIGGTRPKFVAWFEMIYSGRTGTVRFFRQIRSNS